MPGPVQNSNNPKIGLTVFQGRFHGRVGVLAESSILIDKILTCETMEKVILEERILNLAIH